MISIEPNQRLMKRHCPEDDKWFNPNRVVSDYYIIRDLFDIFNPKDQCLTNGVGFISEQISCVVPVEYQKNILCFLCTPKDKPFCPEVGGKFYLRWIYLPPCIIPGKEESLSVVEPL